MLQYLVLWFFFSFGFFFLWEFFVNFPLPQKKNEKIFFSENKKSINFLKICSKEKSPFSLIGRIPYNLT